MTPWPVADGQAANRRESESGCQGYLEKRTSKNLFRLYGINSDKDVLEQPGKT